MKTAYKRIFTFLILTVIAFVLIAAAPLEGEMPDFTNLGAVLSWLVGFGAPYIVGILFAYLAENVSGWHKLSKAIKFWSPLILSVAIAMGAQWLSLQPAIIEQVSPIFTSVAQATLFYLGSQNGYMNAKTKGYAASAQK